MNRRSRSIPISARASLPEPVAPEGYHSASASAVAVPIEQQVAEAMRPPRQPFTYDETPPAIATKTTWVLGPALAPRLPASFPDLPSPTSDTDLSPTQLRVAVAPDGSVQHVMLEDGSGELGASIAKELDQQAALAAKKIRFKPTRPARPRLGPRHRFLVLCGEATRGRRAHAAFGTVRVKNLAFGRINYEN